MAEPSADADPTHIGRYRVERRLGAGGVGMVFAAVDAELGRHVAVKLLRPDRLGADSERAGQRLREEAQTMARLAHPNVATVFEVGEHDGSVYIAMEMVDGCSAREWLDQTARHWREVLNMYFLAARGLAAAHDAGIIHRDFKPTNVLVGRDGRAQVVDFGLASRGPVAVPMAGHADDVETTSPSGLYHRPTQLTDVETTVDEVTGSPLPGVTGPETTGVFHTRDGIALRSSSDVLSTLTGGVELTLDGVGQTLAPDDPGVTLPTGITHSGLVAGTPAYMAPELFLGRAADARSDQFAFCVSLYEGLYGRRPFSGETASAIADQVLAGAILSPPERTRVPKWIHAIIEQGLAVRRQDRHESVRSMLASIAFLARVVWD